MTNIIMCRNQDITSTSTKNAAQFLHTAELQNRTLIELVNKSSEEAKATRTIMYVTLLYVPATLVAVSEILRYVNSLKSLRFRASLVPIS